MKIEQLRSESTKSEIIKSISMGFITYEKYSLKLKQIYNNFEKLLLVENNPILNLINEILNYNFLNLYFKSSELINKTINLISNNKEKDLTIYLNFIKNLSSITLIFKNLKNIEDEYSKLNFSKNNFFKNNNNNNLNFEFYDCKQCKQKIFKEFKKDHLNYCNEIKRLYELILDKKNDLKLFLFKFINEYNFSWNNDINKITSIYFPLTTIILLSYSIISENKDLYLLYNLELIINEIEVLQSYLPSIYFNKIQSIIIQIKGINIIFQKFFNLHNEMKHQLINLDYYFSNYSNPKLNEFEFLYLISKGSSGEVYLCKKENKFYASKIIKNKFIEERSQYQKYLIEKEILLLINSPFTLQYCMYFFIFFFLQNINI